jgi:ABC-type antimicrobial peptide transport system permease subunit
MSHTKNHKDVESSLNKKNISSKIENLLNEVKGKEISALAHMNEEDKVLISKWAQQITDRYIAVLKKHPEKIKNIADLPASKDEIKIAIKILLTAYIIKKSKKMVDILKDYYISIGSFQNIDLEDKEKIIEEANRTDKKLKNSSTSLFSNHHKYMEVIISEQGALVKDLNNFINDLMTLK